MQKSRYYAEKQIVNDWLDGKDIKEIARELNLSISRVREVIKRWTK